MKIIPAIDIKGGKCVRLFQGDYAKQTIYADDPIAVAMQWEKQGAQMLHVVDLDGAKFGKMQNTKIIEKIIKSVGIPIQVGGGIRDKKSIDILINLGVTSVIIGTKALLDKKFLKQIITQYKDKIIISLDSKNGNLMQNGWKKNSKKNLIAFAKELKSLEIKKLIYTDTLKDGTLLSPNFKELEELLKIIPVTVIPAGGISSIEDIRKLRKLNITEVIIGKALYEKRFSIKEGKVC
jgi:phosphoribosylformimino-5-aminoimidazole carboxamide ribotide isomerase